jgi:hypothetical protein
MSNRLNRFILNAVVALVAIICPFRLAAQYVYLDDNNGAVGGNTATGFKLVGPTLSIIAGSPYGTLGTGLGKFFAPVQEVAISYGGSLQTCLFVSDPLATSTFPNGDIAAFTINPSTGVLSYVGSFDDPTNTSGPNFFGISLAIDRRPGFPYLFAGFSGESKIAFYKVDPNTCRLFWASSTAAVGISGQPAQGIAVSRNGPHILAVTYGDGSVQSFKVGGGTLTPKPLFNSTGFGAQGGMPQGVDIAKNGLFVVFGDNQPGVGEVEVAAVMPSGALASTVDFGGPANAGGVTLAPGLNSQNVWLSPGLVAGLNYLYISNNYSNQVTTAEMNPFTGQVFSPLACTSGYTNPTTLTPGVWNFPAQLHTLVNTASGGGIAVVEFGTPSSVALLRVQNATGCTKEVPSSPFIDPNSNHGLFSLDVFPSRPY